MSPVVTRRALGRRASALALAALRPSAVPAAALLAGCAAVPGISADGELQPLAPGVWLRQGVPGEIDPANGGRVGNAGVIVGERGVLVVDSGPSFSAGQALLGQIQRITALPVRALLLTHARQEFIFGAAAFQDAGVPVLMSGPSAKLMAQRCDGCLKTLQRVLGEAAMRGTRRVTPDRLLDGEQPDATELAQAIGRRITLHGFGHSSGPGDLALLDNDSGVLFAGGLADVGRIPDIQDADFAGWQRALAALQALPLRRLAPGHGAVAPPAALADVARYLSELDAVTRRLASEGAALSDVPDAAALPYFAAWDQADTIHRRNASILYLRHEQRLLYGR